MQVKRFYIDIQCFLYEKDHINFSDISDNIFSEESRELFIHRVGDNLWEPRFIFLVGYATAFSETDRERRDFSFTQNMSNDACAHCARCPINSLVDRYISAFRSRAAKVYREFLD